MGISSRKPQKPPVLRVLMIGVLLIFIPLFSYADDDSAEIPLQTILDIGLHLAVLSNDVDNAKALVEMGADANSLSKIWHEPSKMAPSEVAFTYYQRDEANTIEIQKGILFERLRHLGIHRRPFSLRGWNQPLSSIDLGNIYIENIERANHDWLWFRGGKPLEHAIFHGNFAMVELLYPITSKEKSQFPFYRTSEEEYLSFSVLSPEIGMDVRLEQVYYPIANLLIKDILNRDVEITPQTLAELKIASDYLGRRIRNLDSEAGLLRIIKEGISDVFSTLWNEHPLINNSFQYGQYAEKFFKRLPETFSEADEKLNELRAFDRKRTIALAFKNLIDEAVEKISAQGRIKDRPCQSGERRTTTTGAVFTCDTTHPRLGEAWRDPDGLIWGDAVKNEDGSVRHMAQSFVYASEYTRKIGMLLPEGIREAEEYCESIGARLPSKEEFTRLREYMGSRSGTNEGYSHHYNKVLPNLLGFGFWSSLVDPGNADSASGFNGNSGNIGYVGRDVNISVRCARRGVVDLII